MGVKTIGVVGAGTMGRGIAYAAVAGGFRAVLTDVSEDILAKARLYISDTLTGAKARGKWDGDPEKALAGLTLTPRLEDTAAAGLIIEAVPEDIRLKVEILARLRQAAPPQTILASNTSSLSIAEMGAATGRPARFLGMHFFNPVPKMKLVELVYTPETAQETLATAEAVCRQMGKETVRVKDSPGFATSRINALIGNEAFRMLEEGVATPEDIDKALKLGLNHPMGPFEMVDLVGLDVRLAILEYLHRTLGERFKPTPLLVEHVKAGRLGRKVGRGVYDYENK
ncbi:MAG TPA: 3-hydroxyacyl-CoA dehydrogenase NAD-binding domain-containing protein [Candidatus Acidoferrales bacterium]|nr:3-hydroxyacyl-CoA dehydrogenase NAD-binding domain-containing protein [Candidatus Acidoferrales bacterium]